MKKYSIITVMLLANISITNALPTNTALQSPVAPLKAVAIQPSLVFDGNQKEFDPLLKPEIPADSKLIENIVDQALPDWNESILKVEPSRFPLEKQPFELIFQAVDDDPIKERLPRGAISTLKDMNRTVKIVPDKGKVRYVNRARSWDFKKHAELPAIQPHVAEQITLKAFLELGFPVSEIGKNKTDTQIAAGASAGSKKIQDRYEMYRIVSAYRYLNGLPVFGSGARVAVSNEGLIQRLGINWPTVEINTKARLRSRNEVIRNAVNQILQQDPGEDIEINSYLAYARTETGDEYKPVAVLAVNSFPTPYQLFVELTGSADNEDEKNK